MATIQTSLFKQDVRVTQVYKGTSHKGLDLSTGVVEQPVYLPTRAVEGYVWKILAGYSYGGKYYANAPIIYIKHKDGSGSRYIHSYTKNVKVKVGDTIKAGTQVCATGNSGYSFGDHLHFEWLKKWDDLNSHTDPIPYITSEDNQMFKKGDRIIYTGVQNIRTGNGEQYPVQSQSIPGQTGTIKDNPREADGYTWYDILVDGGGSGWNADVGKFKLYVAPVEPPVVTDPCADIKKELELVREELRASQAQVKSLVVECDRLKAENEILKARIVELEKELNEKVPLLEYSSQELCAEVGKRIDSK